MGKGDNAIGTIHLNYGCAIKTEKRSDLDNILKELSKLIKRIKK